MSPNFSEILAVALGGGAGSVLRYLTKFVFSSVHGGIPWSTLLVNTVGCFLIGLTLGSIESERMSMSVGWRLFLVPGFLGGLTTFSTFSWESIELWRSGQFFSAVAYAAASIILGFIFAALGRFSVSI
mgnify:CR=1 FL=1